LEKLDVKLDETPREVYLEYVNRVLEKAVYKYEHRQTKNRERIAWGRLIVQAVSVGSGIVKDVEMEELKTQFRALEVKIGGK
jgi:hypothetical protein